MQIKNKNSHFCVYCEHFCLIEYNKGRRTVQTGICKKHNIFRELSDRTCEDFVIISGISTLEWFFDKKDE